MHCLLWEVIKFLYKEKIKLFDMSESTKGSGVYLFKKYFGCEETKIFYYKNNKEQKEKGISKKKIKIINLIPFFITHKFKKEFSRVI